MAEIRRPPRRFSSTAMRQVRRVRVDDPGFRRGAAAIDYLLGLGVVLPLLLVVIPASRRAMQLVFELTCTLVAWPFM